MIDRTVEVERMEHVISVFGSFDQNLRLIESDLNVKILDRDNLIHITGEEEGVMLAEKAINGLLALAARGEAIDAQNVRYILKLVRNGQESEISKLAGDVICITAKGKPIKPKTLGQREYCEAIANNTVTLGIGPAGTGKTYLAVAAAVAAFRAEKVNRIILTRPAVEAGERLGFLPGDLQSKVDPYLRPLYDALFDMLGPDTYQKYLERGNIEVAPLAYMRGRTLDDSFIILDEAQNTSREQMKMFLTRIGFGSRVVITGDITQIDLPSDKVSGLKVAMKVLEGIDDIAICNIIPIVFPVRHRNQKRSIIAEYISALLCGCNRILHTCIHVFRDFHSGKGFLRERNQPVKHVPVPDHKKMAGLIVPTAGSLPAGFQDLFNFLRFDRIRFIVPGASPGYDCFQRIHGFNPFSIYLT